MEFIIMINVVIVFLEQIELEMLMILRNDDDDDDDGGGHRLEDDYLQKEGEWNSRL